MGKFVINTMRDDNNLGIVRCFDDMPHLNENIIYEANASCRRGI